MATSGSGYDASCFCGAVQFHVEGEPKAQGYCHCTSCRTWSASPVNAFTLWDPGAVRVTKGAERIGSYAKNPQSQRKFCTSCGGHVFTEHPPWKLVDVFAAMIPRFPFQPKLHVHYQESVLPMRDGLPKMKDVPKEMGGSGETLPE